MCTLEPVISSPALWLCQTEGASFPSGDWKGTRSMGDEADGAEPEKQHIITTTGKMAWLLASPTHYRAITRGRITPKGCCKDISKFKEVIEKVQKVHFLLTLQSLSTELRNTHEYQRP